MPHEEMPKNPYEGLDNLSIDELKGKVKELNLDQLSWLNSKLDLEKTKVEEGMANPVFKNYEISDVPSENPIQVNGHTLEELSQKASELELKFNIVSEAMADPKFKNYEM